MNTTEYLLIKGADANIQTRMGDTALHQAAENRQYKIAKLLLINGANPNIKQNDGETPLHLASFKGDKKMVKILLKHKANPSLQNNVFGKTPLHYAVDYSYIDVISLLLNHNANPNLKDKHGQSSRDIIRTAEVQNLFETSFLYVPSPDPSETPIRPSLEYNSPIFSESNSDISISECKTVEHKVKQLEDFHKKIRETVRASVDTSKVLISNNTSIIFEPDAEKTGGVFVEKKNLKILIKTLKFMPGFVRKNLRIAMNNLLPLGMMICLSLAYK